MASAKGWTLTEDEQDQWAARIEAARRRRKPYEDIWQKNIDDYRGKPLSATPDIDWVNAPVAFPVVEQKKSSLFYEAPEVQLTAAEPMMLGREDAIQMHAAILNEKLGPDGIDAKSLMDAVVFDVVCVCGFGATKIFYEATTAPIELPAQPGSILFQPEPMQVDVPIFEDYRWEHVSPMKTLWPADFHSTNFEKAAWLAMEFSLPLSVAKQKWTFDAEELQKSRKDERVFKYEDDQDRNLEGDEQVSGVEIWLKTALFRPDQRHPQAYAVLVFLDGLKKPVEYRPSPNQSFDVRGRLTPDSMIGNPIHIFTLREMTDAAFVPSDVEILRPLTNELRDARSQMVRQRKTSIPLRGCDIGAIGPDTIDKINKGVWQGLIVMEPGATRESIWEVARAQYPRENFTFQEIFERDAEKIVAIGANQFGVREPTQRTATEVAEIRDASSAVSDTQRVRMQRQYLKGVSKLSTLILRFMTDQEKLLIVGEQGVKRLAVWNKQEVAGRLAYTVKADSGKRLDVEKQRRDTWQFVQAWAKSPFLNQEQAIAEHSRLMNFDPIKMVTKPQPQGPPPPNISFRFSGMDLALPEVRQILGMHGIKLQEPASEEVMSAQMMEQVQKMPPPPPAPPQPELVGAGGR